MKMDAAEPTDKASTDHPGEIKVSVANTSSGDSRVETADRERAEGEEEKNVVIDIKGNSNHMIGGSITYSESRSKGSEKLLVCRICHLDSDETSSSGGGSPELVPLGCDCRGELGAAHNHCAEAWFARKGNRLCEICRKTAKNISERNAEDTSIFMMEWEDMRLTAATLDAPGERSRCCKHSFCKFLLACLVLAFVLPWFFRGVYLFM